MTCDVGFPLVETHLPEVVQFVSSLAQDHRSGEIQSWEALSERTRAFYTPERQDRIEAVLPGWREMSSYAGGTTLVHVMCVFIGLLTSPEYERASPSQREQSKWIVLFHDLAKWVRAGARDNTHPFRSAARAGAILPRLGFPVADAYEHGFEAWSQLAHSAVILRPEGEKTNYIHDNLKLPEIVDGIERLFGHETPTALIVKTILLHQGINVLQEWPQAAPLTKAEEKRYLTRALYPLLKMMMLADNDGWELFNASSSEAYRQETLAVFERLADQT
jgi:hypothetical protein